MYRRIQRPIVFSQSISKHFVYTLRKENKLIFLIHSHPRNLLDPPCSCCCQDSSPTVLSAVVVVVVVSTLDREKQIDAPAVCRTDRAPCFHVTKLDALPSSSYIVVVVALWLKK